MCREWTSYLIILPFFLSSASRSFIYVFERKFVFADTGIISRISDQQTNELQVSVKDCLWWTSIICDMRKDSLGTVTIYRLYLTFRKHTRDLTTERSQKCPSIGLNQQLRWVDTASGFLLYLFLMMLQ
jgi:hypothetical protein